MKILFYFSDFNANAIRREKNTWGGVGYYRTHKISELVNPKHTVKVVGADLTKKGESSEERWDRIFTEYDVFWTSYFSDPKEASALFYTRDKFNRKIGGRKKKVILDCDDNFLDIHPSHPLYDKLKAGKRDKAFMLTILSFADAIVVSTDPLKQRFKKHFREVYNMEKTIFVIPNMNDANDWNITKTPKKDNKIIIGYAGSNSHQDDMDMFVPHLHEVMKKYPNVYFESIGTFTKPMLYKNFKDFEADELRRIDVFAGTWTFEEYPHFVASRNWDIGVAPLVDSSFTRCKSHIKYMEYSMLGIPVVASRVYPYFMNIGERPMIKNMKTGMLTMPHEWQTNLEFLIKDKNKRQEFALNAYADILKNWQYKDADDVREKIEKILSL